MSQDLFADPPPSAKRGPTCIVGKAHAAIDPEGPLRSLGQALIMDSGWTSLQISTILRENGIPASGESVKRHRRRGAGTGCACP